MKKLKISKTPINVDLITHNGTFHADEVYSTVILMELIDKKEITICRTSNVPKNTQAFVYDVGLGKYDHHQPGGNGERENGIKYAALGLIWKDYGKEFLTKLNIDNIDECHKMIDKKMIIGIDSIDNGQLTNKNDIDVINISNLISLYNSKWNESDKQDKYFLEAVKIARTIFLKIIKNIECKVKAKKLVEEEIKKSDKIMILERFMPYKEFVLESKDAKDIQFVIYPSNRGGYNVSTIPKEIGSFESRKLFPKEWAGLRDEELQKISGVETITFCHNNRFLCACETLEDAKKIAEIALKEK